MPLTHRRFIYAAEAELNTLSRPVSLRQANEFTAEARVEGFATTGIACELWPRPDVNCTVLLVRPFTLEVANRVFGVHGSPLPVGTRLRSTTQATRIGDTRAHASTLKRLPILPRAWVITWMN